MNRDQTTDDTDVPPTAQPEGLFASYLAAARRDPRLHPFGYLAVDPTSGARGAFLWFASREELVDGICAIEVGLLQLDESESARIRGWLRRLLGATRDVSLVDRAALAAAFEGWSEIAWLGRFDELLSRGGELPTGLRLEFRRQRRLARHAGPIDETELQAFVEFLGSLFALEAR